jgi:hypothetical protein
LQKLHKAGKLNHLVSRQEVVWQTIISGTALSQLQLLATCHMHVGKSKTWWKDQRCLQMVMDTWMWVCCRKCLADGTVQKVAEGSW